MSGANSEGGRLIRARHCGIGDRPRFLQEFAAAHGLTGRFEVLRPVQTWQPENLNPYIQAATTDRWPVADTPQVTVYRRVEVNLPSVLSSLSDVSMAGVSDTKPLIASVKAQAQRRFIGTA